MNSLLSGLRPLVILPALAALATPVVFAQPTAPEAQRPVPRSSERPAPGISPEPRPEHAPAPPQAEPPHPKEHTRAAALRRWFEELDDADAAVREAARVKLMGMRREDLPAFRALVQESLPLTPSQAAMLRQIVTHVFLAGEQYDTTNVEGFLGVKMQETSVRLPAADGGDQAPPAAGVVIVERMPGFAGARAFVDGDVVLGVVERPDVRTLGMYEFIMVVKAATPGTTIHFQVIRQGQVIRVPVAPDPRPFEAEGMMNDLLYRRQGKADAYWDREFAPVMKEGIG